MKTLIIFISVALFCHFGHSNEICEYSVKQGEWVAQVLRSLGSKDPFKDGSYFKTVKLNKNNQNLDQLSPGDKILLPLSSVPTELRNKYCSSKSWSKNVTKSVQQPLKNPLIWKSNPMREPSADEVKSYKLRLDASTAKSEVKSKKEYLLENPFPILEYEAGRPDSKERN